MEKKPKDKQTGSSLIDVPIGKREYKYPTNNSTKTMVVIAILAVIYGVTSLPIFSPAIFPETNIRLALAIQTLGSVMVGPLGGFLIGFVGGVITDLFAGWGVWLSWIFASALVGGMLGFFSPLTGWVTVREGIFTTKHKILLVCMSFVAASLIGVAGVLDYYLYAEPFKKVMIQCMIVGATQVGVISTLGIYVVSLYAKRVRMTHNPIFVEDDSDD